jgi:hypothetical protein
MMKKKRGGKSLKAKQKFLLARQQLTQQTKQVAQQKKLTFNQLENLISLARQAKNTRAIKR